MSLLQRIREGRMPRPGEYVIIHQDNQLLAEGNVIAVDAETVSIAGQRGLVDLDTVELRRGLGNGSITVRRPRI